MALGSVIEATVASRDVERAVAFARDAFGLEPLEDEREGSVVGVRGVPVGRVRFVPAAFDPAHPRPELWEPGGRLLGIYSTDLDRTGTLAEAAGGDARPIGTFDIGRETPLRERLVLGPDDLIWTVPSYRPMLPTPALESDPQRLHGELHSAVLVVDDADAALELFAGAGGMTVVYDGPFGGEEAEHMLGLPPGASLRNAVLAGEDVAPARLEILQFFGVPVERRERTIGLKRITFEVEDVEGEPAQLREAVVAGVEVELRRRA